MPRALHGDQEGRAGSRRAGKRRREDHGRAGAAGTAAADAARRALGQKLSEQDNERQRCCCRCSKRSIVKMTAIRLSPSGPVIGNTEGGPLSFGPGARLRLSEANSVMGGSLALPTVPDVISPDGFGDIDAIVLTLT